MTVSVPGYTHIERRWEACAGWRCPNIVEVGTRYCGDACRRKMADLRRSRSPLEDNRKQRECRHCKAKFRPKNRQHRYCTPACKERSRKRPGLTPRSRSCEECGTRFEPRPNQRFCTPSCRHRHSNRLYRNQPNGMAKVRESQRRWRAKNPEYAATYQRIRYRQEPELFRTRSRRYYEENREAVLERQRARRKAS